MMSLAVGTERCNPIYSEEKAWLINFACVYLVQFVRKKCSLYDILMTCVLPHLHVTESYAVALYRATRRPFFCMERISLSICWSFVQSDTEKWNVHA